MALVRIGSEKIPWCLENVAEELVDHDSEGMKAAGAGMFVAGER